jgi:hypothetical protein
MDDKARHYVFVAQLHQANTEPGKAQSAVTEISDEARDQLIRRFESEAAALGYTAGCELKRKKDITL